MNLRSLVSAVLTLSISMPTLADPDHLRIRIAGYEMVLSVPSLRNVANPSAALDSEIIEGFAEAEQRFPSCSNLLSRSLRGYRFIRPRLLDNRSAWIHESIHRYTSSISSRLSPILKDGSCTPAVAETIRRPISSNLLISSTVHRS